MSVNNDQQQKIQEFVTYLLNLTPNELGALGSLLGVLLSQNLTPIQQNVFGNFFELIGQVMLAMGSQGQYVNETQIEDSHDTIINNEYPQKKRKNY